jgi:hypothetical protein
MSDDQVLDWKVWASAVEGAPLIDVCAGEPITPLFISKQHAEWYNRAHEVRLDCSLWHGTAKEAAKASDAVATPVILPDTPTGGVAVMHQAKDPDWSRDKLSDIASALRSTVLMGQTIERMGRHPKMNDEQFKTFLTEMQEELKELGTTPEALIHDYEEYLGCDLESGYWRPGTFGLGG